MRTSLLTSQRLRELLEYDRETGVFVWKIDRGSIVSGSIAGMLDRRGYLLITVDGHRYMSHRLAWLYVHDEWPAGDIDHKDTIKNHNWIANLRPATNSQNQQNTQLRSHNKSGFKGVYYYRRTGKWQAYIKKDGAQTHLGYFETAEAAHSAYVAAAKQYFGEYART